MKRALVVLVLLTLGLALLHGCTKSGPSESTGGGPAVVPPGGGSGATTGETPAGGEKITVVMVPKMKGNDYFAACEKGANEAAEELGIDLVFDGPTEDKVDAQIQLIEGYIAQNVDVIAASPNDPASISSVLKKARDKGIRVMTFDADASAEKSGREFFVNQASEAAVAQALVDEMVAQVGEDAKIAIITASLTAANQNAWIAEMEKYMASTYPKLTQVCKPKPSEEDQSLAFKATQELLKTYPELQGILAISSAAFPGAADAVQQAKRSGEIAVVGLATPKQMKPWVDAGTVKTVILWNPVDLAYLTVQVANGLATGTLEEGATTFEAGRLGEVEVSGDQVLLGAPMRFTKDNIAQFDF